MRIVSATFTHARMLQKQQQHQHQQRCISLLHKMVLGTGSSEQKQRQQDLDYAIELVRRHDPAGYLPGRLLPTEDMRIAYFAVRSFWVETGLRFGSTAQVPLDATPSQHLQWWQRSMDALYQTPSSSSSVPMEDVSSWQQHPTLRLVHSVIHPQQQSQQEEPRLSKVHFDQVLESRRLDLDVKQYPTMLQLQQHAEASCGSLLRLVLESGGMTRQSHPVAHDQAARLVGTFHGMTNALRTSIPVVSTTGKLVIPYDLCQKHGISSPRYLLTALGQGDEVAQQAMARAVEEIAHNAMAQLQEARALREQLLAEDAAATTTSATGSRSSRAVTSVFLPALASETFMNRLQASQYNLTDRNLRHVGVLEHVHCATRMILANYQRTY